MQTYRDACNAVSEVIFKENTLVQAKLHKMMYRELRSTFGLKSQMAQSVLKTVIAKYKTNQTNGHERCQIAFKKPQIDLVFNRDYSITKGLFSINTLEGRIKVPFQTKGLETYFDGTWTFGTAKLVNKHNKWFLHIPVSREMEEASLHQIRQVVGVDMGVNFIATVYDSNGQTLFFKGRQIKHKRAKYKQLRRQLQKKQNPLCPQKIKENRSTRKPLDARCQPLHQ
ncbi:putative transposase [Anoxybacillus sp. BCO1]|nr:putative transposase [Anoxybacillus sp. BCO1]